MPLKARSDISFPFGARPENSVGMSFLNPFSPFIWKLFCSSLLQKKNVASICIPAKLKTTLRNHYGSLFRRKGFDSPLNGGRGGRWEWLSSAYKGMIGSFFYYIMDVRDDADSGGVQRTVTLRLVLYCLFVTGNFMCIVSSKNHSQCIRFISLLQLKKRNTFLCVVQELSCDWSGMWSGRGYHTNIFFL